VGCVKHGWHARARRPGIGIAIRLVRRSNAL
jgi:hypothetical protein